MPALASIVWIVLCVLPNRVVEGEDHSFGDETLRNPVPICRLLCGSERSNPLRKERPIELCSRGCVRNYKDGELSGSFQAKERTRRANENPEENACLYPTRNWEALKATKPSDIWVNFEERKPNITVRWSPTEPNSIPGSPANWTWYALMYHDSFKQKNRCILIPKEQNEWIIRNGDDWDFPHMIYLGVSTYPYDELELKPYAPIPKPPTLPPTPDSRPANKVIVALVGVTAGILLLLVFLLAYRKRFGLFPLCSTGFVREPVVENSKINNSCVDNDDVNEADVKYIINHLPLKSEGPEFFYACYFPENEKFTRAVAGIVNYFRQNGYPVVMDVMSSNEMVDLGPTRWAEQQIKKAHKILVFLSPGILRLCGAADEDKQSLHQENERVWYEMSLLRTIYSQTHSAAKMVCITLPQGMVIDTRDIPLWAEMRYRWPKDKRKILNRLNDRPFILPL